MWVWAPAFSSGLVFRLAEVTVPGDTGPRSFFFINYAHDTGSGLPSTTQNLLFKAATASS